MLNLVVLHSRTTNSILPERMRADGCRGIILHVPEQACFFMVNLLVLPVDVQPIFCTHLLAGVGAEDDVTESVVRRSRARYGVRPAAQPRAAECQQCVLVTTPQLTKGNQT